MKLKWSKMLLTAVMMAVIAMTAAGCGEGDSGIVEEETPDAVTPDSGDEGGTDVDADAPESPDAGDDGAVDGDAGGTEPTTP
ncbi:hypothetical protein ABEV74_07945 [Paenibacillus cisolokensis]|uniref:Uncharacterized protein n=1 Tax=Paenibacillus cisolokensis TaxID=1658519 RepID=A0ABQ4N0W3_9BACL|nr:MULTISPECIES: hypothetical protein [Paenibacillus]ALS26544.1 hypothetical protein IJ21_11350 [Paenibacillus sp. 32O-W]GIQ61820.1 hypothetical protein PACILC2_03880 [Paenibacillus cisolokensis]